MAAFRFATGGRGTFDVRLVVERVLLRLADDLEAARHATRETDRRMNYLPPVTGADVFRILERDFHVEDRAEARALLGECDDVAPPGAVARVHLALLKLSDGSISRLREQIAMARIDFRDVITPAEYPEFHRLGFAGAARLSLEEREALKLRDWQQYEQWLTTR